MPERAAELAVGDALQAACPPAAGSRRSIAPSSTASAPAASISPRSCLRARVFQFRRPQEAADVLRAKRRIALVHANFLCRGRQAVSAPRSAAPRAPAPHVAAVRTRVPSSNQLFGAGWPHSVCRCGSRSVQRKRLVVVVDRQIVAREHLDAMAVRDRAHRERTRSRCRAGRDRAPCWQVAGRRHHVADVQDVHGAGRPYADVMQPRSRARS